MVQTQNNRDITLAWMTEQVVLKSTCFCYEILSIFILFKFSLRVNSELLLNSNFIECQIKIVPLVTSQYVTNIIKYHCQCCCWHFWLQYHIGAAAHFPECITVVHLMIYWQHFAFI